MVAKQIWDYVLNLFKYNTEKCVVAEQNGSSFFITEARVNELDKTVRITNTFTAESINELRSPFFYRNDYLVLALNSESATTIESAVCIKRVSLKEPITEEELEQLTFQGLWEFLNNYRLLASKKMGIADLELVLANVEITDVSIGKYRVINPLGLTGGPMIFRIRGTFISRNLIDTIAKLRNLAYNIITLERDAALSTLIARKQDLAGYCKDKETNIFLAHEDKVVFENKIQWGISNLIETVALAFSVEQDVANIILKQYLQNNLSKKTFLYLSKKIQEEISRFIKILYAEYKELTNKTSRSTTLNLYFPFSAQSLHELFSKRKSIQTKSLEERVRELRFSMSGEAVPPHTIALLIYTKLYPKYEILNNLLKRRAKWLIARI